MAQAWEEKPPRFSLSIKRPVGKTRDKSFPLIRKMRGPYFLTFYPLILERLEGLKPAFIYTLYLDKYFMKLVEN